jgi:hypothetical protein
LHLKKKIPTTLPEETTTGQKQLPKIQKIDRAGGIKTSQKRNLQLNYQQHIQLDHLAARTLKETTSVY